MAVLVDNLTPRLLALLWSTVLLSRGAADCPKPPEKEHIVLTNESLLKNAFPKDTEVTFVCTNGYEKHNGSERITCTGTEWTQPDLMCKKKDCGYPQKLPNMILIVNGGTLLGASVKVTCEEGYRVLGSSFKRCFASGWIGRSRCDLIVCDVPIEVISGQHTWTSAEKPRHGDIIQYSCDPGFTLNGTSHVICQGRGVYNTTPPTCEAVVCDLPSEINDGRHLWTSADRPRYEDEIHYSCNTGFTLHGSSHLICQSPGVYNAAPPTCKEDESTTPTLNITSTPRPSIQGNLKELDIIKEPDRDTKDADVRRNIVVASVISTILVVLMVLLIFYVYRYRWRRGNAITSNEEYNVCYHGGSEGQCGPAFPSKEPYPAHPQTQ
ncbi:zona pellucida sperm-binding protein 3 receptor isoform X5 [Gadus macrocephalus]|uniref:zona pellucida sperm-binding protein 3 receptor isoform X5 n=1 Tax=Gadus macrocephalus TaxID=80720 RepID=UPI0028CB489A|nr:zona pellucida sperm-binding protein 3 receptor isoform X5 [Gadus macrocephalus]